MGRFVGIDFGTVRIGLAISDLTNFLARPLPLVRAGKDLKETAKLLYQEIVQFLPLDAIILGLPLHMNNTESILSKQVRLFATLLEEISKVPVILWDERLSTAQVERTLKESSVNRKKRTKCIDSQTAAAILQNYLDTQKSRI